MVGGISYWINCPHSVEEDSFVAEVWGKKTLDHVRGNEAKKKPPRHE